MLTQKYQDLVERYPQAGKIIEVAGKHEEHTPIYAICEFLLDLVYDITSTPVEVATPNKDES